LVNDNRDLNKISTTFEYFFPSITVTFTEIQGSSVFSQIDLEKGFTKLQLNLLTDTKLLSLGHLRKFEYNRRPLGLQNAPKFFNNIISSLLSEFNNVIVFIDDILIFSNAVEEHLTCLDKIFSKLLANNVIINFEKSNFMKPEVKYLGYILDGQSYRPNDGRLHEFHMWKRPETRRQLQKLLDKMNFYTSFIENMWPRISHLYEKLKSNAYKIVLSNDDTKVVDDIYYELKEKSRNYLPDANQPFHIHVDASEKGIRAVLSQEKGVIAYWSKKFSDIEARYTFTEKEALAALKSIEKWQDMIEGSKIMIFTDSRNNLGKNVDLSNRIQRWKAMLSDFDIQYKFIDGEDNVIADELSRFQNDDDPAINAITDGFYDTYEDFLTFHNFYGHPGIYKTIETIKLNQNFNSTQRKRVIQTIKNCKYCQKNKRTITKYGLIKGTVISNIPFQDVSLDVFVPFNTFDSDGDINSEKMFVITFTDRCTSFSKIIFTTDISANNIIECFTSFWLSNCPVPKTFLSDNGTNYSSHVVSSFLNKRGIKQIFKSVYNPTGNSLSERINSDIILCLKIYRGWDLSLIKETIENRINHLYNRRLKNTPDNIRILENYEKLDYKQNDVKLNKIERNIVLR
ncbi:pol polyprotein, partial [Pseudoloma neurophilia]